MEQNKLKLEDCCLTIEQAKKIQELGIDMDNALFEYIQLVSDKKYIEEAIEKRVLGEPFLYNNTLSTLVVGGSKMYELVTKTLTNTEILGILPKNPFSLDGYKLKITKERNGDYTVGYFKECNGKSETFYATAATKLRDALFEMIRILKINKLYDNKELLDKEEMEWKQE